MYVIENQDERLVGYGDTCLSSQVVVDTEGP